MNVLVVGCGSIGRRHLGNLRRLGLQQLAACDPDAARLQTAADEFAVHGFHSLDAAFETFAPDAVFVCTPPVGHIPQARQAIAAGAHVFIEKPLSHSLEDVDTLTEEAQAAGRIVQVGYNLRFHPGLRRLRALVQSEAVGPTLWGHCEFGQYLPDWRPGQDYRQSYTARRALGGGILLDASHELDYPIWLFGPPVDVACVAGRVSQLETDVEDCATVLLRFAGGTQIDVHVDGVQRHYVRTCRLVGTRGSLHWDYTHNEIRIARVPPDTSETLQEPFTSNDMYVAEVQHFLACVAAQRQPLVGLDEARLVLATVWAAKAAAGLPVPEATPCSI